MFTLIENNEDLSFLNKELLQRPYIGVDTEFRRTSKSNMRLALLQINDSKEIFLIDTVSIEDPMDSCSFLSSRSVTKVFHSFREDLEAIYSWTGEPIKNVFDTQFANSLLDGKFSVSYQDLVKEKFGVSIEKKETQSNWLKRPLRESQLDYAASDVLYLVDLYLFQLSELKSEGKSDWLEEEVEFMTEKILSETDKKECKDIFLDRPIRKAEERKILEKFGTTVEEISKREKINPTFLLSKINQREFLKLFLKKGLDAAMDEITPWKRKLLKKNLEQIFKITDK